MTAAEDSGLVARVEEGGDDEKSSACPSANRISVKTALPY